MYDHMKSLIPWSSKELFLTNLQCFHGMLDPIIVIDPTEFLCEKPISLVAENIILSKYKHHTTYNVLVGVTPNEGVTFISSVWGGRASDRHTVKTNIYTKV